MTDLSRAQKLFLILSAVFVANAILAEFIGVKIFALEPTLGIDDVHWSLFGQNGTLNFTAGVLLWPPPLTHTPHAAPPSAAACASSLGWPWA